MQMPKSCGAGEGAAEAAEARVRRRARVGSCIFEFGGLCVGVDWMVCMVSLVTDELSTK